jgi:hypothetical protein
MIVGGKHLSRGQVVDDSLLTDLLKGGQYVDYEDLGGRENRVLLLQGITYTRDEFDPVTKQRIGYPITLARGELVRLDEIPERQRQDLREGIDYKRDWVEADRMQLREKETQEYLKHFQPEPSLDYYDA